MNFKTICFGILFFFISTLAAKDRIGVLDFTESDGIPTGTGKKVSEIAIMKLLDSGKYTVIDRASIDLILKEQALQKSGCTDTECAIQTGKLLAANLMLNGNIIELDRKTIVSINVRNIQLGKVEFAETMSLSNLSDLEKEVSASIQRFIESNSPKKQEADLPKLTREQEMGLALNYAFPGIGHIYYGQYVRGILFSSGFLYVLNDFIYKVPNQNERSKEDIISEYREAIALLPNVNLNTSLGANQAGVVFGNIYQHDLQEMKLRHRRTMYSAELLVATFFLIHLEFHVNALDNYFLKKLASSFMRISFQPPEQIHIEPNSWNRSSKFEIGYTWRF